MNRLLLAFGLMLFSASAEEKKATSAVAEPAATDFIRFVETDEGDSLQTAIASYLSPAGVTVDLIGAVHIADKKYFDALNTRFKSYEVVLYELVGRPIEERDQLKVGDGDSKLQWLGALQEKMRATLKLESQLKVIDYKAKNFVHADLSTEGFFEKQEEKKETFITLWMKAALAQAAAGDSGKANSDMTMIMTLLMSKDNFANRSHNFLDVTILQTLSKQISAIRSHFILGQQNLSWQRSQRELEIFGRQRERSRTGFNDQQRIRLTAGGLFKASDPER